MKNLITAIVCVLGLTTSANAALFKYDLFDHPGGSVTDHSYGIRVDEAGPRFFSFGNGAVATLTYDDVLKKVRIAGTVVESLGGGAFGATFDFKYIINGVDNIGALGSGLFRDLSGTGTGEIVGGMTNIALGSQADSHGRYFIFKDDGARLPQPSSAIVGRGWVNVNSQDCCNDFLFIAESNPGNSGFIPLPAAAWMLLSGVAGLGVVSRRRRRRS